MRGRLRTKTLRQMPTKCDCAPSVGFARSSTEEAVTRKQIKNKALIQIAEAFFGWDTDDAMDMSDETALAIQKALAHMSKAVGHQVLL
jgi:hypothetical protein